MPMCCMTTHDTLCYEHSFRQRVLNTLNLADMQ